MNKEEYHLIIDEAYDKYFSHFLGYDDVPPKEVFVLLCKTDNKFSEKWGLKIEERELTSGERMAMLEQIGRVYVGALKSKCEKYKSGKKIFEVVNQTCNEFNIPTKLITITYNDKTIESYE